MDAVERFLEFPVVSFGSIAVSAGMIVIGTLIVVLTFIVTGWVSRGIVRVFAARGAAEGVQFALTKIVRYALLGVGTLIAFSAVGIDLTALLAASTVLLVGIGFGLQNVVLNFISGVILLIEQPVRKGDFIKVGDAFGMVEDIGLRATTVITPNEATIVVPNSQLVTAQVVNHSLPTTNFRIRVDVTVDHGSDPELVKATLLAVGAADASALKEPPPEVRFEAFAESGLAFSLRAWIADPRLDTGVCSDLRFEIARAFKVAGIQLPVPECPVHAAAAAGPAPLP